MAVPLGRQRALVAALLVIAGLARPAPATDAGPSPGAAGAPRTGAPPGAPPRPPGAPAVIRPGITVEVEHGGRVSVLADGAPTGVVLEALSTALRVPIDGRRGPDRPVRCKLRGVTPEAALARLLRDEAYTIMYDCPKGGAQRIARIVTFGPGEKPAAPDASPQSAPSPDAGPRQGEQAGEVPPSGEAPIDEEARGAFEALSRRHGTVWDAQWDKRTGLPTLLYGSTGPLGSTPQEAARRFLEQNTALFKLPSDVSNVSLTDVVAYGKRTRVEFTRQVNGIAVIGSSIALDVDETGSVWSADVGPPPGKASASQPQITREAALKKALDTMGAPAVSGEPRVDLSYLPRGKDLLLVWRCQITAAPGEALTVIDVDATDGSVVATRKPEE